MNKHFLIILLTLCSIIAKSQLKADSLVIYKDFKARGTTANLWHYHHDADSLKIPLAKISDADLVTIKELFSDSKQKKYFQQKHGGELFLGFVFLKGQKYKIAISSRSNFTHFVNLSEYRNLKIQDSIKASKFNSILLKYSK